jgi:Putative Ig domain
MTKFSLLLFLTLVLFTVGKQEEEERTSFCFGDEVTIDLSNPSAVKPLIYTLDKTHDKNRLPPGLSLDRRTGVVSGVLRDVGFQNTYQISVIGTDPTDDESTWEATKHMSSEWCTGSRISRFLLINTDTNKIVRVVRNGDTIDLDCLLTGGGFSMEVETFCEFAREAQSEGDLTSRVDFTLDGKHVSTATTFPYTLGGHDGNGNYLEFPNISAGQHVLTAMPYNPSGDKGFQKTITFTIVRKSNMQEDEDTHESLYDGL